MRDNCHCEQSEVIQKSSGLPQSQMLLRNGGIIVAQARTWLGTAFKHQGRLKHVGCDCIGLVVGVVAELGLRSDDGRLLADFDRHDYSRIPDGEMLSAALGECLISCDNDKLYDGDILLMRFEKEPQHVAIVSQNGAAIIHCYQSSGKVVEHRLDAKWRRRIVEIYRLPDRNGCSQACDCKPAN